MLTCYGHECRLPRGDLTYVAFRTAALATIDQLQLTDDLEGEIAAGERFGFLAAVPLLAPIDPIVQLDLLGEVWARQHVCQLIEATLLDAAVVYAACDAAAHVSHTRIELIHLYLREGPRRVRVKVRPEMTERFEALFDVFWDDIDFLSLSEWQDMPAEQVEHLKQLLRVADDTPLFQALDRGAISSDFGQNLRGLLTKPEVAEALELGQRTGCVRQPRTD